MTGKIVRACTAVVCALTLAACEDDGTGASLDTVKLQQVASGLTSPVALVAAPGSQLRFVVDQAGQIRVLRTDGTLVTAPFLDVRNRMVTLNATYDERGLLGLAFHPSYATNGRFYVYYSAPLRAGGPAGWNHTARISEFRVSAVAEVADATSERVLLEIDKPQSNHNGGTLAFGPDGFLYISIGDGGGANDLGLGHVEDWFAGNGGGNAQFVDNLLGKILRIDVTSGTPYTSPASNPFVNRAGRDEIYAYGFRNPYRFSFDRSTGDLYVGDAGQNRYEEVSRVTLGGNYGWNLFEGAHCFDAENPDQLTVTGCPTAGQFSEAFVPPVIEYPQTKLTGGRGVVVVGGYVYRGSEVDALAGKYVFGDFSRSINPPTPDGSIFVATPGSTPWSFEELTFADLTGGRLGQYLLGFGQDGSGELYVLATSNLGPTGTTGRVYKIVD
jgi:glucose/arabinose dehydrogenase